MAGSERLLPLPQREDQMQQFTHGMAGGHGLLLRMLGHHPLLQGPHGWMAA
jgi:hypothetical protein